MQTEILANDDILRLKFGVPRRVLARLSAEMKAALAQALLARSSPRRSRPERLAI
jgi:hypothetical protein